MARAERLPSGSWRCRVFSHKEKVWDAKTETWKLKSIYETFTSSDKTNRGKKEVELAAANFSANKESLRSSNSNMTLGEAIDKYIASCEGVLAPSTIYGYRKIRKNSFQTIMDRTLKSLSQEDFRDAVSMECKRLVGKHDKKPISPKTVANNYGLITAALNIYYPRAEHKVKLPQKETIIREMPNPLDVINAFRGDRLELAVLLSMWLSFTMSEIRGLTKSESIYNGEYIVVKKVVVKVGKEDKTKKQGKKETRNRMHHIPPYIKTLIDKVDGDVLVPYSSDAIYSHYKRVLRQNNIPHISFHSLRHLNASIMALLRVPDKYAQERGGWKTDTVMKKVYTHTFTEERVKVDQMIDDYFEKIIFQDDTYVTEKQDDVYNEDMIKMLKEVNTDGRFDALINKICHEICHEN